MFTNRNLLNYAQELSNLEQSVLRLLLHGRIREFRKNNQHKIDRLLKDIDKLQKEYLKYGADGNVIVENPDAKQNEQKPKIQEGKTFEGYNEAMGELMNKNVDINF